MWMCACVCRWLSLGHYICQKTLVNLFLLALKININVMSDKHIFHQPPAIQRLNALRWEKRLWNSLRRPLEISTSAILPCLLTLWWPWLCNSISEEAPNKIIRRSSVLLTNGHGPMPWSNWPQSRVHCQGGESGKTSITTELHSGHTSCGWGSMRSSRCCTIMIIWGLKNVCLVTLPPLPLSTNPLPWEKTSSW